MNILFITFFFLVFMVSEIRSVFLSLTFSLQMLPIDLRIETRLTKMITTIIYKNTPTYLTKLQI